MRKRTLRSLLRSEGLDGPNLVSVLMLIWFLLLDQTKVIVDQTKADSFLGRIGWGRLGSFVRFP
jgi:hypothetical protein